MPVWSADAYLAYADERTRPFADLLARIPVSATTIVDLGCGPGHLMPLLRSRWPDATITGVDSSPEMIAEARRTTSDPAVGYRLADIAGWEPEPADIVVSNAAYQWVPGHLALLPHLARAVRPGGAFAFQVPNNAHAPSHVLMREVAQRPPYADATAEALAARPTAIDAATYLDAFAPDAWSVDAWETTYLHVLQGADPVYDWVTGTAARPLVQALPPALRPAYVAELQEALRSAYPRGPHGTVFAFRRVFVVAVRRPIG